jgi:hypothetical protein
MWTVPTRRYLPQLGILDNTELYYNAYKQNLISFHNSPYLTPLQEDSALLHVPLL